MCLGNIADVLRPVFPVPAAAALDDDPGVDRISPVVEIGEVEVELCGHGCTVASVTFVLVTTTDADDLNLVRAFVVEFQLVDDGVESVIVSAKGLEYLPDNFVLLVIGQGFFWGHVGRDAYGEDDIAEVLPLRLAHDAADGLYDIHYRIAGVQKHDGIKGGDVHAFRKAAGIAEDAANVPISARVFLEPLEQAVPMERVHRAVHMPDFAAEEIIVSIGIVVGLDDLREAISK